MQISINAAGEARKPMKSSRLAKAAALVATTMLATQAGAAIAAGEPQGRIPELDGDTLVLATDRPTLFAGSLKTARITWRRATPNLRIPPEQGDPPRTQSRESPATSTRSISI
jgi:hypothetical protein